MSTMLEGLARLATSDERERPRDLGGTGSVRAIAFDSEMFDGTRSSVFAYVAGPEQQTQALTPAVVLVHGGGGRAFPEWATMWAQRGYLAIAVDLAGAGPDRLRHDRSGPTQDAEGKFSRLALGVEQTWMYHAVAAVVRAISVAVDTPSVDPSLVFLTGISWGSHVAQLVTALDPRVRRAAFVYGAGFIEENTDIGAPLASMPAELVELWVREFDQKNFLDRITAPTLWISGTNDQHYDLELFQRSIELVPAPTVRRVLPGFGHSHEDGWSPVEIAEFFGEARGLAPLPSMGAIEGSGSTLRVSVDSVHTIVGAHLHIATGLGPWSTRRWMSLPARVGADFVEAPRPANPPSAAMFSATDMRGVTVSSPVLEAVTRPDTGVRTGTQTLAS